MQIRDGCVFRERDQRLTEGPPEQDAKGEKTYQATRARGLAPLMPAMLRQKRQLTYVHGKTDQPTRFRGATFSFFPDCSLAGRN